MRSVLIAGVAAVLLVCGLLAFLLLDAPTGEPVPLAPTAEVGAEPPEQPTPRAPRPRPAPAAADAGPALPAPAEEEQVTAANVQRFGQEFERRWVADRDRLGPDRHREMEQLWFEGRRPRGEPAAREKLERLLRDYPDTNRAGCAALELGHHWLRDRQLGVEERRKKAAGAWRLVVERHADSLCEYNAPAAGLAELALASQVLRYTDPAEARRVLEDIIAHHQGETDHLGQPLEKTARALLDVLR